MKVANFSFLIALFLPEDTNHDKAKEIFKKEDLFLILEDIVKETLTVICCKKGMGYAKDVWKLLSNSEAFEIVKEDFNKLLFSYISLNKKIFYFDSSVIYFSLIYNSKPASFNRQLISIWKKLKE